MEAINWISTKLSTSIPTLGKPLGDWSNLLWFVLQDLFRLQQAQHQALFDNRTLLDQMNQLLQDQEAFCYELGGKIILGISSTQVEVGDYVFHPSVLDGVLSEPTRFALIIRPCRLPAYSTSRLFHLVGACVDSCVPFGIPSNGWYQTEPYSYPKTYDNADLDGECLVDITFL
jgi:hypothetical protein